MKKLYRIKEGQSVAFKQPGEMIEFEEPEAKPHLEAGRIEEIVEESEKPKKKSKGA